MRRLCPLAVAVLVLAVAGSATAHDVLGRAQPAIAQSFVGSGASRRVKLVITDADSGRPIPDAVVTVTARKGRAGRAIVLPARKKTAVVYLVPFVLPSAGEWSIGISVGGTNVAPQAVSVNVAVAADELSSPAGGAGNGRKILIGAVLAALLAGLVAILVRRRRPVRRA